MRRICVLLCLVALLALAADGLTAAEKYEIVIGGAETAVNPEGLNPYFFLNYFYTDALLNLDLLGRFTIEEKTAMVKRLFANLREEYPAKLIVKDYIRGKDLEIAYRILNGKGGRSLVMLTNYNARTKRIVTGGNLAEAYATLYYIKGKKLVSNHYIYTKELEDKNKDNPNNLADLYIFDDVDENDAAIEKMLLEQIGTVGIPSRKFVALSTLCQYYLSVKDLNKTKETLQQAFNVLENEITEKKEYWGVLYTVMREEYAISSNLWP